MINLKCLLLGLGCVILCNICIGQGVTSDIIEIRDSLDVKYSMETIASYPEMYIGNENADIILHADSIVAKTIAWEGCKEESIRLPPNMSDIIKYTFCTPPMYLSNKKVYASFQPYLILTFHKDYNILSIQFDYDINKWMIKNGNDVIICRDLKNSALLPLFYILFPNNPLIENSYKNKLK